MDVICSSVGTLGRHRRRFGLVAALVALIFIAATPATVQAHPRSRPEPGVTVATYNLYLGADLRPLFAAQPGADPVALAGQVYESMVRTNFPERAEVIAREIAEQSPAMIGLQEVALWQTAPISQPDALQPAYDFLAILLAELEARGAPYEAVAANVNFSAALPISDALLGRFTDRDVILARAEAGDQRAQTSNPTSHTFSAVVPVVVAGQPIEVPRGWSSVDVRDRGRAYRFVNTHLEAFSAEVRGLQARELAAWVEDSPLPVVLVGDLNTARGAMADAYGVFTGAGFIDAWVAAMGEDPGYTAGQAPDLMNQPSQLDHTVDYVLYQADACIAAIPGSGAILGEEPEDRTPSGLWPSDHAGVAVTLHLRNRACGELTRATRPASVGARTARTCCTSTAGATIWQEA